MPYLLNKNGILELLKDRPEHADKLWIEAGYERAAEDTIQQARIRGIPFRVLSREEFHRRFKDVKSHICLETQPFSYTDPDVLCARAASIQNPFLAAFDAIYDPQNLGNVVRSAACFSADAIVLPRDRSCGVTETAANISRGGIERVTVARVINIHRYLEELKKKNIFCFGLDQTGKRTLWEIDLTGPICLVFGSEQGLRRLTRETCDEVVKIPTSPDFPSLNVATCFAVASYEVRRQRAARP